MPQPTSRTRLSSVSATRLACSRVVAKPPEWRCSTVARISGVSFCGSCPSSVSAAFDVLRDGVVVGRVTQKTVDLDEHAALTLIPRIQSTGQRPDARALRDLLW